MKEISEAEQHNIDWLYSVLNSENYTDEFKKHAYKNLNKFESIKNRKF